MKIDVKKLVLKISGKLIDPSRPDLFKKYVDVLRRIYEEGIKIAVITGGGVVARDYIKLCREISGNEGLCDMIGIEVSRLNALLLSFLLGDIAYRKVPESFKDLFDAWASDKIIILGGIQPGQSTSAVAAAVAEVLSADLLIYATVVEGVYNKDPREPGAVLLKEVNTNDLRKILSSQSFYAGGYELIDHVAINIIERSRINTYIINGFDPENILRILRGEKIGTKIIF